MNRHVDSVLAPTREAAIKAVIGENQITDPEKRRRLVAWPERE